MWGKSEHQLSSHPEQGTIMTVERSRQPFPAEEIPQLKEQSIFDFYSVPNEVRFVQELTKLPTEDKVFYVKENVLRFLGEFVGKVPYTKISYLLKDHGLEFAGIRTAPVYERSALMTDGLSREADEWVGYRKIENALLDKTPGITWISPPKDANYGLVFHFQKNPDTQQVDEYILRYTEPSEEVSISQQVLKTLQPNLAFMNTSAFLRNPLSSSQPDLDLKTLLTHLGVDSDEIETSKLFEAEIKKRIWPSVVKDYFKAISTGDIEEGKRLLIAYFNWAQDIKKEIDNMPTFLFKEIQKKPISPFEHPFAGAIVYYSGQAAIVVGGGSCPVTRAGNSTPFSQWNIRQNLKLGLTVETIIGSQVCEKCQGDDPSHFHCPGCGGSIESGKGIETCPHCDLNKDDYAKQTGVSC